MTYQAIAFDLDGTLLNSKGQILDSSKQAIHKPPYKAQHPRDIHYIFTPNQTNKPFKYFPVKQWHYKSSDYNSCNIFILSI